MRPFAGWRAAVRIARRDALRAKGRSILVAVMIALPILGVTAASLSHRSLQPTLAEKLTAELGSADARFVSADVGPVEVEQMPSDADQWRLPDGVPYPDSEEDDRTVDVPAALPTGSRHLTEQSAPASVTTRHGMADARITEVDAGDPMLRGRIELVDGAYPKSEKEIAATAAFAKSSGLSVGDRLTVREPDRSYTLTGLVELPADLEAKFLYALPGAVIAPWQKAAAGDKSVAPPQVSEPAWLVKGPPGAGVTWSDVRAANKKGVVVTSRQVSLDPPPDAQVPAAGNFHEESDGGLTAAALTVAAMAVLEIVLLAGPAFAVGARRSRRQLGLVASCGGTRSQVRAVVLAGGALLGGIGAVAGVAAGFGLTFLFRPMIEEFSGRRFGELAVHPWEIIAIAAIGLVTGVLASLAPAVVAGRQSVLESLTGRRGSRRNSRALPTIGAVLLTGGTALALYGGLDGSTQLVAVGSVLAELGLLCCIPVIVGVLGRLGRRLPLIPRIALRDAARNQGRAAPAVAAVMAAVAGSVAIATYTASTTAEEAHEHRPNLTAGTAALMASDTSARSLGQAAVEQHYPLKGAPVDIGRPWAGSNCSVHSGEEGRDCGSLELVKPSGAAHSCPLSGAGATELALRISADEHRHLMDSPACTDEKYVQRVFHGDDHKIVIGGVELLDSYVKLTDPEAAKALASGTPVLLNSAYAKDGTATIKAVHAYSSRDPKSKEHYSQEPTTTVDSLEVYVAPDRYAATPGIRMIMPKEAATDLGLQVEDIGSVYTLSRAPSEAEQQAVEAAIARSGNAAQVIAATEAPRGDDDSTLLILALFAAVVTLGAAATATGLSRADAEADLATLSAVGAPPGVGRSLPGFQSLVVAFTGVLLGTAAGLVPAVALRLTDLRTALAEMRDLPMQSAYTPIVLPWPTIAFLAVAVPVLAGLLAAALATPRTALARRAG
ncbi:ABC transporter permease [Streptomyces sp. XM4193]|uniref:FtsX-like permease family protein n=1 Tax=Streptomyces sp. XM4193 TaxID=2929782 RepID=UPI001FFB72CD|nr:FtsX-like permease family protein [Streptomyces sp. XM4193]MCK1795037.1 ABC transporter permease [Streptomyces sp. XM4193]